MFGFAVSNLDFFVFPTWLDPSLVFPSLFLGYNTSNLDFCFFSADFGPFISSGFTVKFYQLDFTSCILHIQL